VLNKHRDVDTYYWVEV